MNAKVVDSDNIPHVTRIAVLIDAAPSLITILWSVIAVPELPLSAAEVAHMRRQPRTL